MSFSLLLWTVFPLTVFWHWITQIKHDFSSHFSFQAKVMGLNCNITGFSICSVFLVYYIFAYETYGLSIQFYLLLKETRSGKAITSRESHHIVFRQEFLYISIHKHYKTLWIKKMVGFYTKHRNVQEKNFFRLKQTRMEGDFSLLKFISL